MLWAPGSTAKISGLQGSRAPSTPTPFRDPDKRRIKNLLLFDHEK